MEAAPFLRRNALVLDVCSLKMLPCQWMADLLPKGVRIVGTHPLFGPQSAPDAIIGQKVVVCPIRGNPDKVAGFLSGLGLEVIQCSPDEHDRQMAVSQALTHFIGRSMDGFERVQLTTKTFDRLMDIVQIINGNSQELFEDMQHLNPYAAEVRRRFIENCKKVDERL